MQEEKQSSMTGIILPPGPPDPVKFQEIFAKYDQEMVELPWEK